jgi:predicted Zn-dependent protease
MRHRERYAEIDVTLIEAPLADGQSFPGGSLVFTTALLETADEATVAAVVAHELAHLDLGHVYTYAKRVELGRRGVPADQFNPAGLSAMMTRGAALGSLFMNPYKPEHELAADCQATTWLFQAGYDPGALAAFFERLNRIHRDQPVPDVMANWRSHPYSLERKAAVERRLAQLRRWKPNAPLGRFPDNLRRLEPHEPQAPAAAAAPAPAAPAPRGR